MCTALHLLPFPLPSVSLSLALLPSLPSNVCLPQPLISVCHLTLRREAPLPTAFTDTDIQTETDMVVSLFRQWDTILFSCDKSLNLLLKVRQGKGGSLLLSREWRCSFERNGLVSLAVKLLASNVRFLYWTKFRLELTLWWKDRGFRLVFDPLIFYI